MSEELDVTENVTDAEVVTDVNQESSQTEEPQYSESELQAIEMGWKPKEQLEEGKEFVSAEEFIRRGELFDKIDILGKELKDTKKALRMLTEHHEKVRVTEYQRALQELRSEKKTALEEGDADKLIEIDEKITDIKAQQQAEQAALRQQANAPDPRFLAWVERNAWYAQDVELRSFADEAGVAHAKAFPTKSPEEVLQYVAQRVRKAFPDKFQNPNRTRPSAVEGASTPRQAKVDNFSMSDDEKKVMHTFVRQGVMTKEEYIAQLKAIKGVE